MMAIPDKHNCRTNELPSFALRNTRPRWLTRLYRLLVHKEQFRSLLTPIPATIS